MRLLRPAVFRSGVFWGRLVWGEGLGFGDSPSLFCFVVGRVIEYL